MRPPRHATGSAPRDRAFWVAASVLVLGQLIAFWMLCSHQVRMAEVRRASTQVEALAMADCMRYVANATLAGCMQRVAPLDRQDVATAGQARVQNALTADPPVNTVSH